MIPNRQLGYNYIASTSNVFTEGKSYRKIDNYGVDGASNVLSHGGRIAKREFNS